MLILAKAVKGQEFLYTASSAHKVSKNSANKIKEALNKINYHLNDGETWWTYEVDQYDIAYDYAQDQTFTVYKGKITDHYCYY